jgi:hypothetical protein
MSTPTPTVESLVSLARQLPPAERARLIEQVAASLAAEAAPPASGRRPAFGALADLHLDVSEEDIAEARRDMLANFPREDVG